MRRYEESRMRRQDGGKQQHPQKVEVTDGHLTQVLVR